MFKIMVCSCSSPGARKLHQRKLIQTEAKSSETGLFRLKVRLTAFPKSTHASKLFSWRDKKTLGWSICIKYSQICVPPDNRTSAR